ncbi:MAG: hypothetical protein ACLUSV_10025 [Streptococcus sp.]
MRTKDFIYYASATVLMAVTTQVASADEVATQIPTVAEGSHYQAATAADILEVKEFWLRTHRHHHQHPLWQLRQPLQVK